MGGQSTKAELQEAQLRAESRAGKVTVSGRYNRLPKRIEDFYEINRKKVLGSGYNGSVFLAWSKESKRKFAIKSFRLNGIPKSKKKELMAEAEIFLSMDHPHVARLADVFEDEDFLHLVMECMEGGELFQRVIKKKRFSEKNASEAGWQMLLAINYLHSRSVVHRDLKLENFLYESEDSNHLKLIDFGFSHVWEPGIKMATRCGTLAYVAPEVLKGKYTSQCDMWSFGVIVFILLAGYMPFSGKTEEDTANKICAGSYPRKEHIWSKVSHRGKHFVQSLLILDPLKRLTAEQALEHDWICMQRMASKASRASSNGDAINQETVDALCSFAKASQFKRACMSLMAWSLTNEERKSVRDEFIEMDVHRTGTISLKEFQSVMASKFDMAKDSDINLKELFAALDVSHNEEIHYAEFLAAMVSTRIAMHDEMLAATFKRFDVDDTGFITVDNLKTVLGDRFDGAEAESLLAEADREGNGQLSYEEFIAYLKGGQCEDRHLRAAEKLIEAEKHSVIAEAAQSGGAKPKATFEALNSAFGLLRKFQTFGSSCNLDRRRSKEKKEDVTHGGQPPARSRACEIL
eukprot:TRINITY_DN1448_c0_g2_i1.p1 TRINITY_DN1448_c0_g2~~TRINITY_DN1448_c0_g2_i1.p1  ORF type:complete len:576 (+),score=158.34 TRINITY_DN1448_c0_g2_i1:113-1840(+)